jgi:predicted CXXCH cytochrome family protein
MLSFAPTALAQGISGSLHDFSGQAWSGGKICIVCHTPHNGATSVAEAPLWNHDVTAAAFALYSTSTLDASDMGQPDGASKLCLSCHDGTVALDSFGGAAGSTNISGSALVGTDLSNDHPISFTYDSALATADGQLYNPSVANSGLGGTITADMLFADKIQCASCHDVHNSAGNTDLLRIDNAASALCLTCHNK